MKWWGACGHLASRRQWRQLGVATDLGPGPMVMCSYFDSIMKWREKMGSKKCFCRIITRKNWITLDGKDPLCSGQNTIAHNGSSGKGLFQLYFRNPENAENLYSTLFLPFFLKYQVDQEQKFTSPSGVWLGRAVPLNLGGKRIKVPGAGSWLRPHGIRLFWMVTSFTTEWQPTAF